MQTPRPIPSELINSLRYVDGALYWAEPKKGRSLHRPAGTPIHGYQQIKWGGKHWSVHRIIWEMHNGYTELVIDHINRDSQDNRLENLRAITFVENLRNRNPRGDAITHAPKGGRKFRCNAGVQWKAKDNRWVVTFKGRYIGSSKSLLDAWAIRKSREATYFGKE